MRQAICQIAACCVATATVGVSLAVFLRHQLPNSDLNSSSSHTPSTPQIWEAQAPGELTTTATATGSATTATASAAATGSAPANVTATATATATAGATPTVAAIVAVHPPKFHLLLSFFKQWLNCVEGQAAVEFMPVFSTDQDRVDFANLWKEATHASLIWTPLVAQAVPPEADPKSWKKFEGVAQVLEMQSNASTLQQHTDKQGKQIYEFALMLDSEIALHDCAEFSNLHANLRSRHEAKVWYGDYGGQYNVRATQISGSCIATHMQDLRVLGSATHDFTTFTWWNDLPYVHLDTANDMFSSMALHNGRPNATPTEITSRMGLTCGTAYEHLVYQAFTILHRGFKVVDLTNSTIGNPSNKALEYSFLELFWTMDFSHKKFILEVVSPKWLPWIKSGAKMLNDLRPTSNYRPHLLWYHVDRKWMDSYVNKKL